MIHVYPHSAHQVNTWSDSLIFFGESSSELANYCGSTAENTGGCELRAALAFAATLVGSDVIITVTAGQDLVLTQAQPIQISG